MNTGNTLDSKLNRENIRDVMALTPLQEGMLFHYLKDPHGDSYFEQLSLGISGAVDIACFEQAWNVVIDSNEMLRTVFRWEKIKNPTQAVLKEHRVRLRYIDAGIDSSSALETLKAVDREKKFDLRDVPFRVTLCRLAGDRYEMIISNHHIIYDGWSTGIILKEFFSAYNELASGNIPAVPSKSSFKEFVRWTQRQDAHGQETFWREYLRGVDPGNRTELPVKRRYARESVGESIKRGTTVYRFRVAFNSGEEYRWEEFVKGLRITPAALLYGAWGILLQRYVNGGDVVFGTAVSGRSARVEGIEDIVGLFINTVPLRFKDDAEPGKRRSVGDALAALNQTLRAREAHEHTPLVKTYEYCGCAPDSELFDTLAAVENYPLDIRGIRENGSLRVDSYSMVESTHYDLTVVIRVTENIDVEFLYREAVFEAATVRRMGDHFNRIIREIVENPEQAVVEIDLLSPDQRRRILEDFNDTRVDHPTDRTLHGFFEQQAARMGDRTALTAKAADGGPIVLTYCELDKKSREAANVLAGKGVKPGDIAAVKMERSVEMVAAIFGILKAGAAYLPIAPGYPEDRVNYMLADSSAKVLVEKSDFEFVSSFGYRASDLSPSGLAYIIYTSGSTGRPKGVMVEHCSIVNTLSALQRRYPFGEKDVYLLKTSYLFDVSAAELFGWYWGGGSLAVLEPGAEKEPAAILGAVERMGVTHINFVPSMFTVFVDRLTPADARKLSSLKYLFLAGEALLPEPVKAFRHLDASIALENIYGPTEASIYGAWYSLSRWDEVGDIPIGTPLDNVNLFILDRGDRLQPVGVPGELVISGAGLARGYLNRPELTAEKFNRTNRKNRTYFKIYRTGDLAVWREDGNIDFLGRIDYQVKIRGYRIEPGEIESLLRAHPHVKEAIVKTGGGEGGDKYLCAYVVPHNTKTFRVSELRSSLEDRLPDYMVPSYFVALEKMPLNPNGKVDRKALPQPDVTGGNNYVSPRDETEKLLVDLWSGVLNMDGKQIGIHDNFFRLGGHSLKAVTLMGRIHKVFSVEIPIGELFKKPTVESIAHLIDTAEGRSYTAVRPVEKREYYAVSSAQKRLFVVHGLDPGNVTYNIPAVMALEGKVENERFESAFKGLIRRHESLRTSFKSIDGQPVQVIHDHIEFKIEYLAAEVTDSFIRSFDLSCAPLLRVGLAQTGEDRHLLVFDVHHIVSDGVSGTVLVKEFMALYRGETLPPLAVQYKDFALWQNELIASGLVVKQGVYWQRLLEGELPLLNLPTDYSRPAVQNFEGNSILFNIEEGNETEALERLALETGSTLYTVLFAVYNLLLTKLSGQEDIVVGTPAAGRRHPDIENIVGMFVNILPVRTAAFGGRGFTDFLGGVRETLFRAFENQDYQYEELLETLTVKRELNRNPLFDTVFVLQNMQNMENRAIEIPGLVLMPLEYNTRTSKFDLTLQCVEEGKRLRFRFEYSTRLFKETTVRRFIDFFRKIISDILENPGIPLPGIEIISEIEKKQVLMDFNDTAVDYPRDKTIHRLFEECVERSGDRVALVYGSRHISYLELNRATHGLALRLKETGVRSGDIVGIEGGRSAEMVIGILGILKAGGVFLPIDADYPEERKRFMLADSNAGVLLSGNNIERLNVNGDNDLPARPDFAYIMYTSGSTGVPKGVIVTHRNVVRLVQNTNFVPLSPETRVLQTGAPVFDATTFEIWGPLLNGGRLVPADRDVILDAFRLGAVLRQHRVNTLWLSAPLFNQLLQQDEEMFGVLDYLLVGGDVLSPPHINRVRHKFPALRVINGYGPTENTTFSCTYAIDRDFESNIPIGRPISNSTAYIVDRYGRLQPVGIWGELVVGGDGVAAGYLNNPELTAERFSRGAAPFKVFTPSPFPLPPFYKTGDLARWLSNGTIEFSGRIDRQVKIRGFRVETGEIESRLLTHETVEEAVVIDREHPSGDRYLCAYIVYAGTGPGGSEVREYLSRTLPDYMIPSYFIPLEKIPLDANGKVDRRALPEPAAELKDHYVAPRDEVEKKMAAIWSEILSGKTPEEPRMDIGIDDDFFQLGGHSLKAGVMISRIHKTFGVKLSLVEIFENPTVRGLSQSVKRTSGDMFAAVEPAEKRVHYPLSSPQKRLYLLWQMQKDNVIYNVSWAALLKGKPVKERFEEAFRELVKRHESFRTTFEMIDDGPVQVIHDDVEFNIDYYENKEPMDFFIRPFDLSRVPLLRVGLAGTGGEEHLLMVDMHHIITDGTSMGIFVREFMSLYRGEELPPPRLQYKDYAQWQVSVLRQESLKKQEIFWLKAFPGEIPVLDLPLDFPRPAVQRFEGESLWFELNEAETQQLKYLARREDATLFMTLLAVLTLWLSRLSGQEDIIVGSPIAARRHADLDSIVGMFVNTLALRNYPSGDKPFRRFLMEVKERTLEAYENQEYPFEELVDILKVSRDAGRNPVFDVAFVLQNMDIPVITIPGLTLSPYPYKSNISRFDLTLNCEEDRGKLVCTVEYAAALFERATIERFITYFRNAANRASGDSGIKLSEIEIITEEEKETLLHRFNDTRSPYPADSTIHQLFERQSEQTPGRAAVVYENSILTYKELDAAAGTLAAMLREKGVHADTPVGVMVERSLEMAAVLIAVLKAGGAYLPVNPGFPAERVNYMLADSSAPVVVTTGESARKIAIKTEIVFLENIGRRDVFPLAPRSPQTAGPAYIMYTSGSTGIPKGVLVEHRNVVRLVKNTDFVEFRSRDRILQTGALEFDASTFEIWGALLNGLTLCLADRGEVLTPRLLKALIRRHDITTMWMTSALFNQMSDADIEIFGTLTSLLVGGDALSTAHINRLRERYPRLNVINGYGPTENTTFSTTFRIDKDYQSAVPIGRPIANSTVYIVDKYDRCVPVGVPGELIVSGDGVSRGYLNDPQLTADRFNGNKTYGSYRSYRTGDRARWRPDGTIDFLGRIDHQVKVRGFRVEMGEIEYRITKIPGVKEAVVLAKTDQTGEKYLCAYIAPAGIGADVIKQHLSRSLPNYMVPSHFVSLEKLPLTPNGKIDRKSLPEPGTAAGIETGRDDAPRDRLEQRLADIWRELLVKERIGIYDDFFEIGGHSLKALHLLNLLQKEFNVKIDFQDIFQFPTIAALSDIIRNRETTRISEIRPSEDKEYYELSYTQQRLWLLYQFAPDDPAFNLPERITLRGPVDKDVIRKVFHVLVKRHDAFRSRFAKVKGEPVMFIQPPEPAPVTLETADISHFDQAEQSIEREQLFTEEGIRPFVLDRLPLYRLKLVTCGGGEYDLLLTMHHIIADGWSMEVLEKEFFILYNAYKQGQEGEALLPPLHIRYSDYAAWHNRQLADREGMRAARLFWESRLSGSNPVLDLPYDFPSENRENKESAAYRLVVPEHVLQGLRNIAGEHKASLFMVLLTAYNLMLSRITGQDDIILAVPGAARQHHDLKNIVGLFVNTLILKCEIDPGEPFTRLLERVQADMLHVLDHQSYPLELICSEFKLRYPEISVFFNMSIFGSAFDGRLENLDSYHIERVQNAKFDIVGYVGEYRNAVEISTHYYTALFKPVTIEKMMQMYSTILEGIARDPEKPSKEYFKSPVKRKVPNQALLSTWMKK